MMKGTHLKNLNQLNVWNNNGKANVDFSNFYEWHNRYKQVIEKGLVQDFLKNFLAEMAFRVVSKTAKNTPVGTPESTGIPGYVGGSLRGAWQIGDMKMVDASGNVRNVPYEDLANQASVRGNMIQIEILNGMDYASFVEFGHATRAGNWVEGRYMLTVALDEVYNQMDKAFQIRFKQWAESLGLV